MVMLNDLCGEWFVGVAVVQDELPVFSVRAECPKCRSVRTRTIATIPQYGVRHHQCKEKGCQHKWKTAMAETLPQNRRQIVAKPASKRGKKRQ